MALSKAEFSEAKEITKMAFEQPVVQDTELSAVMKQLTNDEVDKSGMQRIDLITRLEPIELSSMLIHDAIVNLGCLPTECLITTRVKKRLSVSLKGEGRKEMVEMVRHERSHRRGMWDRMKGAFGGDSSPEV